MFRWSAWSSAPSTSQTYTCFPPEPQKTLGLWWVPPAVPAAFPAFHQLAWSSAPSIPQTHTCFPPGPKRCKTYLWWVPPAVPAAFSASRHQFGPLHPLFPRSIPASHEPQKMLDLTMVSSSSNSSSLSCESPTSLVLCTPHSPNPYLLSPPAPKDARPTCGEFLQQFQQTSPVFHWSGLSSVYTPPPPHPQRKPIPPSPKTHETYLWWVPPAVPANLSCVSLISFILCIHPPHPTPNENLYLLPPKHTRPTCGEFLQQFQQPLLWVAN